MREQQQTDALTARLTETFARDKTEALEAARLEAQQKVDETRAQTQASVEARLKSEMDQALAARDEAQATAETKVKEADEARAAANANLAVVRGELDQTKRDAETALLSKEQEAKDREARAREEATAQANATAATLLAAAKAEKEAALSTTIRLKSDLERAQQDKEAALAEAEKAALEREAKAREDATAVATAATSAEIAAAIEAKAEAEAKATAAEHDLAATKATHDAELTTRLAEQREALEKDRTDAVNAEKSAAFEANLKLSGKVEELQRALEKKTAEELGEGAEIDLFEALKEEFEGDRIERIAKGLPGADIRHTIIHNGRECGKILYDSKNHGAWRNDFVTKLKADQMADHADHAVLSTSRFPAGHRQLAVQEGVVIAGPARIVAVVQMIRAHLVQSHTLRIGNEARARKTDALYSYMTSQQCADAFARLDEHAQTLLDIQEREKKAHEAVWKQQGLAIRAAMKVQADMLFRIESIIGTASAPEGTGG